MRSKFRRHVAAGFRVGRQLAERYTANRARLGEPLEVIKFICKEFWADVFRKQASTALPCVQCMSIDCNDAHELALLILVAKK